MPCRHCLRNVAAGEDYLILAYRPFPALQPYAETGPIFLHAEPCAAGAGERRAAGAVSADARYILRGYGGDDRIVYGSGAVVPTHQICGRATNCSTGGHRLCAHALGQEQLLPVPHRARGAGQAASAAFGSAIS